MRRYMSDKVSAVSSATMKPSRASAIAGLRISASVKLPEPNFSSASASPATVPGTPIPRAESRDFAGSGLPSGPRKTSCVIADGAVSGYTRATPRGVDHHEAAAADISGARISHRQREAGRDRGIYRIAALPKDIGADDGGELLLCHHHAVFGRYSLDRIKWRRCIKLPLLPVDWPDNQQRQRDNRETCAPTNRRESHVISAYQIRSAGMRQHAALRPA